MKARVAKSEITFYIQRLVSEGFMKVSDTIQQKRGYHKYSITLKRGDEIKVVSYDSKGWLEIL